MDRFRISEDENKLIDYIEFTDELTAWVGDDEISEQVIFILKQTFTDSDIDYMEESRQLFSLTFYWKGKVYELLESKGHFG